ncbi:hypothetical protein [Nocardiopsis sp. NPDC006938]|uniref:hypothetical protein n=1 Tax=Nocardiopsis sp. NPDC006938 TaxID=3364337 RepID=UPI003674262D
MPERDPVAIRPAAKDRLPRIVREEFGEAFRQIEMKREGRREFFALGDSNNTPFTIRVDAGPLPDNELVRVYGNTSSDNHVILLSDQLDIWTEIGFCWATRLAKGASRPMPPTTG